MLQVGLTGGIGSGKSTVARILAELGAVVVDADAIARDVVAPGTPGLAAVGRAFPGVVIDGALDRAALAVAVFADPAARATLEAITHPLVFAETRRRVAAAGQDAIVVHDVPLIVEAHLGDRYDVVVVVGASADVRRARLRRSRGMSDEQVAERMAAQATDAERRAVADHWIANEGTEADLRVAVERLWRDVLVPANAGRV